ncbi:MAG: hypothetical protein OXC95_10995 [Dehalococcoidia bacterium]|nr:hypothetical protein [Dehalococcoidia bacterium]
MQRVVLRRVVGSHSMPRGAVVATARLIEFMRVVSGPDSGGLVSCRGFGELGDKPEYDATITTDPYGDFSMGRWLWVFQDLHRVESIPINDGSECGRCQPRSRRIWCQDRAVRPITIMSTGKRVIWS